MKRICLAAAIATAYPFTAMADGPVVVSANATQSGDSWRFDVTVSHGDTGWEHYANGWEVAAPDGTQLGYRKLLHPHVDEQPFTRSLTGVTIPAELNHVIIRAEDLVHGWGEPLRLDLK